MTPLVWMRQVRDAVPKFTTARLAVLWALALRMDVNGTGFASHPALAADASTDERTAKRATADARDRGYLVQTRRGHRLGNGVVVASEWRLSQRDTGDTLISLNGTAVSPTGSLNGTEAPSQRDTGVPPRAPTTRAPSSTARDVVREHTDATDDEADAVVAMVRARPAVRSLVPFLRRLGEDGDLADMVGTVRAERAKRATEEAYRLGWHCRCGYRNRVDAVVCHQCHEPKAVAS